MGYNKKSQASIEFIMTYGWAVLVVLVAIASLSYFGVFEYFDVAIPESCVLISGLTCPDFEIGSNGVKLLLRNSLGMPITVKDIRLENCNISLSSLNEKILNRGEHVFTIGICDNSEKKFSKKINISYTSEEGLNHKIVGSIVGRNTFEFLDGLDNDGDGASEFLKDGIWQELSIEDMVGHSTLNRYQGHNSHYLYWPLYMDQEIWYINADTGEKISLVASPATVGNLDFKVVKCQNDGEYGNCTIDVTEGCGGLVKNYGDLETSQYTYDDSYLNCETGNSYVGRFAEGYNSGSGIRFYSYYHAMTGYGKYQVCAKYTHSSGYQTGERCTEYIAEYLDMDNSGVGGNKNYGDMISFSASNIRTRYDNQPVAPAYLYKYCYVHPWGWGHSTTSDDGPSVMLLRHGSWADYWAYLGIYFGISSSEPGGYRTATATIQLPSTCYLRDRDGSSDYSFYHADCGWYHGVNGADHTTYCCGTSWSSTDTGNCDEFSVAGMDGGIVTITGHIDPSGDNYDDTRIYIECPGAAAFANEADPYTVSVTGADYFWVSDMDYSTEMSFTEALPDQVYSNVGGDYDCNNLELNICGRAYTYIYLANSYEVYGSKYTSPNYVCVSGPQCPHTTC